LKDLPELILKGSEVEFENVPTLVIVRKELSKARHRYFTFLSQEGCEYLRDYLEWRMSVGERLDALSAVISPRFAKKQFVTTTNIGDAVRKCIRNAGFRWRPYVLRSYFDTQLMLAESKGLVLRDYRQFWMGHKGDIEARYTTNKGRLPQEVVEDMRDAYSRSQKYLQTVGEEKDIKAEFRRQLLLVAGFKQEEVEKMNIDMGDEEFQAIIREKLLGSRGRQKVLRVDEIEEYLSSGWEFVATLPDDKVVLKSPL
jgi:hypothetical protein